MLNTGDCSTSCRAARRTGPSHSLAQQRSPAGRKMLGGEVSGTESLAEHCGTESVLEVPQEWFLPSGAKSTEPAWRALSLVDVETITSGTVRIAVGLPVLHYGERVERTGGQGGRPVGLRAGGDQRASTGPVVGRQAGQPGKTLNIIIYLYQ